MRIEIGIASTTHIDRHQDKMMKSALDGMALQIHDKYIRRLIDHDPNQAKGVILAGKVLPMDDGEWALVIITGVWENKDELAKYKYGEKNTVWSKYLPYLEEIPVPIKHQASRTERSSYNQSESLADLLEKHLNSTAVWPDGTVLEVKRFIASVGDFKINIYPRDHNPPHFHVISRQRNIDARFDLKTFEFINHKHGHISSNDKKKIKNLFKTDKRARDFLESEHKRMTGEEI